MVAFPVVVDPRTTDPKNVANLAAFMAAYDKREGPREGDWIRHPSGYMSRITADWESHVQPGGAKYGRYHLNQHGASYSGSCEPCIPVSGLRKTEEVKDGSVWIWDRGFSGAGRGVDFVVPFRVYETDEPGFAPNDNSIQF